MMLATRHPAACLVGSRGVGCCHTLHRRRTVASAAAALKAVAGLSPSSSPSTPSAAAAVAPTSHYQQRTGRRLIATRATANDDDGDGAAAAATVATTASPASTPAASTAAAEPAPDTGPRDRRDVVKAIAVGAAVTIVAAVLDHDAVERHQAAAMAAVFCVGYAGIIVEDLLGFSKAGVALGTAVSLWIIRSTGGDGGGIGADGELAGALTQVSELIYFLLGAMTIVEVVDAHGGFRPLAALVSGGGGPALSRAARNTRLLWGVGAVSFLVSAVLDNLTTTIVVLSVLQRAVPDGERELRRLLGAAAVIAANAGGAWTPIGDVTTTMLWIGGQLTPLPTMRDLLVPSLACIAVPLALLQALAPEFRESGSGGEQAAAAGGLEQEQQQQQDVVASTSSHEVVALSPTTSSSDSNSTTTTSSEALAFENASQRGPLVLAVGLGALLSVPVFKHFTGLPPYMGTLCGLSILWLLTDTLHFGESRSNPRVSDALRKLDFEGVFFFLGILLAVGALEAAGVLTQLAAALAATVPSPSAVAGTLGLVSALVDNVPLVAATMGMYDLATTPPDSQLWQLIALCAGTGGSLLVIGSAAGVAFMSIEGAGFGWYLRRVTPSAAAGYGAGLLAYALMHGLPFEAAVS